jgi:hypothetical protein
VLYTPARLSAPARCHPKGRSHPTGGASIVSSSIADSDVEQEWVALRAAEVLRRVAKYVAEALHGARERPVVVRLDDEMQLVQKARRKRKMR